MSAPVPFQTPRLSCRPPEANSAPTYRALFNEKGPARLALDRAEWERRGVAPWTLSHAGHDLGVGGFNIGFGRKGLQLSCYLLPEQWGNGLASEFVAHALDYAVRVFRETDVYAIIGPEHRAALKVLEKSGFRPDLTSPYKPGTQVMCWSAGPARPANRRR
ncbi:GNAT family N-acetyltransferase [Maritalea mobilis]|uniref:GNAT family N-acetyltransferase n=1 Tax=Maritalea mobilis TaxID=483324 RepID=UPI001C953C38|nr:GNAT family N-acetyltransferase [Maritalea mobilis]MBY6200797.1 GNAT family N-acetyltransferase [Maritalea mobilis]